MLWKKTMKKKLNLIMILASIMVISSYFLPWKDFVFSWIIPLHLTFGFLDVEPTYVERSLLLIPIFPLVVLIGLYFEKSYAKIYNWKFYFSIGVILIFISLLNVLHLEAVHIGSIISCIGSLILCISSYIRK